MRPEQQDEYQQNKTRMMEVTETWDITPVHTSRLSGNVAGALDGERASGTPCWLA